MKVLRRILNIGFLAGCVLAGPFAVPVFPYEIDDFTERHIDRADALDVLDRQVNLILDRAAREVNLESKTYCSFAHLRAEILRWIRPDPAGLLEIWANRTNEIQQTKTRYKDSVYGDVGFLDSPALWLVGIGRSIRLNGHMVGTDKIGHFFMQGLDYYDRVKDGKPLDRVLVEDHGEDGIWGVTGVRSYADMSANYSGYLFWSSLVQGENPYFKCISGSGWVKQRSFSWKDYVSDAWDEGINCSEMKPAVKHKFEQRLKRLGLSCPVDPERCVKLIQIEKAQFIVSPQCHAAAQNYLATRLSQHTVQTQR